MATADPPPPAAAAAAASGGGGITEADIDALLAEMNSKPAEMNSKPAEVSGKPAAATPGAAAAAPDPIDALLAAGTFDDPPPVAAERRGAFPPIDPTLSALPLDLPNLQRAMGDAQASNIDLLRDVELNVKIELGRSQMLVEDVLKLSEGSIVELDKLAGDPVDVFVNDRLVARGEVLVLNDSFCVRVNEIVAGAADVG